MFSKTYKTFPEWLAAQRVESGYARKIARLHFLHPNANLTQLRRHPSRGRALLGSLKRFPGVFVSPRFLSAREQRLRQDAIDVAREMRRTNDPLSTVAKRLGVNRGPVARRLDPYLKKRGGRYVLSDNDRIPRAMLMYDERGAYTIIVRSRKEASKVGRYLAALKRWRQSFPRDNRILAPFKRLTVTDENGVKHRFLTDPIALSRLFASREIRFESVYRYVS